MDNTLTQKQLKSLFYYYPDKGVFIRKSSEGNTRAGQKVGWRNTEGYLCTEIHSIQYKLHRLAFLYMEGRLPPNQVDHINRNKEDNSWGNLCECTHFTNQQNRGNNNSFVGVHKDATTNTWRASLFNEKSKRYKTHLAACYARHCMEINRGI